MARPDRYHRQSLLRDIGDDGQGRLARAHAMIVGVGALGTTSAQMLARAGVGTITLVDRDLVERTNLQRQTLYTEAHALDGTPKAVAAKDALGAINSEIEIRAHAIDFNPRSARTLLGHATPDVLIDGTDNLHTRYLMNDLAVREGVPYCYAGAVGTGGLLMTVLPGETPCVRCLFPEPPALGSLPTCDTAGVLGPVASAVASLQAVEAIKILIDRRDLVLRTMRELDPWAGVWREIDLSSARDPGCPCCANGVYEFADGDREMPGARLCGRNAVQITPTEGAGGGAVDMGEVATRLASAGTVTSSRFRVKCDLRDEPLELTLFPDGRAIVSGTEDESAARAVYDRYVGS